MLKYAPISYLATALVLLAVYYISKPKLRGQYFIIAADCTWLSYAAMTGQWALAIQSIALLTIALSAVRNWKQKGIEL